jgi:hypothetical protein
MPDCEMMQMPNAASPGAMKLLGFLAMILISPQLVLGGSHAHRLENREVVKRQQDILPGPESETASWMSARASACGERFIPTSVEGLVPVRRGGEGSRTSEAVCSLLDSFRVSEEFVAIRTDSVAKSTHIYVGAYWDDAVLRFRIDSLLARDIDTLPIPYGVVWIADDLDRDGILDLVLQRGDGLNGFLDIVSMSTWSTRQRFTFPGMNVVMYAQIVQLDDDAFPEIYLTPGSVGGVSAFALIDYNPVADSFLILDQVQEPIHSYKRSAVADFDNDGRLEFAQVNDSGVGLHEWLNPAIVNKGQVLTTPDSFPAGSVVSCRPKPGGVTHLLIGDGTYDYVFHFWLLEPVGDDAFRLSASFERYAGVNGAPPVAALDSDCDGLDELMMWFYPDYEIWAWDQSALSFQPSCVWDNSPGGLTIWDAVDLNWDGSSDWVSVNPINKVWVLAGGPCLSCDTPGVCSPPPMECVCVCHADPACDDVTDVLDVVKTIDVAFRGSPEENDTGPLCAATQTDLNCSGTTDIVDVVKIVNVAFRSADPATEFCDPCTNSASGHN